MGFWCTFAAVLKEPSAGLHLLRFGTDGRCVVSHKTCESGIAAIIILTTKTHMPRTCAVATAPYCDRGT